MMTTAFKTRRRLVLLTEGSLDTLQAKTAVGVLRYLPDEVACVLDSTCVGRNLAELLGFGGNVPIVATAEEALRLKPTALLIGVAAAGGRLPLIWEDGIFAFLRNGFLVICWVYFFFVGYHPIIVFGGGW